MKRFCVSRKMLLKIEGQSLEDLPIVECLCNMAGNEQGLALLGYLKNVSRQLKPNIVLKVEDMN